MLGRIQIEKMADERFFFFFFFWGGGGRRGAATALWWIFKKIWGQRVQFLEFVKQGQTILHCACFVEELRRTLHGE